MSAVKEPRKKISKKSQSFVKMAEFVLNNNYLKFNEQTFLQFSGPVVGAKFASSYVYIYTDQWILTTQEFQPLLWLRHIDDIFSFRLMERKSWRVLTISGLILNYDSGKRDICFFGS